MTQIAVSNNAFPIGIPSQTAWQPMPDEKNEGFPEQRYFSMQLEPLSSGEATFHPHPIHQIQVFAGTPGLLPIGSFGRSSIEGALPEPIGSFLGRQSELFVENKPAHAESHDKGKKPLFLLPITLSENSKCVIGENGSKRFEEFKRYPDGWDYGRGTALSARSLRLLNSFLKDLSELRTYEPSLFLTHQGNLQLGWEDVNGNVVELEFYPDRIEYYVEVMNEEGSVGIQSQAQLIEKIKPTVK